MQYIIHHYFEWMLCLLLLIGRLGDILSTYWATPTLKLEGNLLARKLGWPFVWLSILLCLIPFYSTSLAIVALVPSLLVSASNIGKIWLVRSVGETQFAELLTSVARKQRLMPALFWVFLSSSFIILAGVVLIGLCPDPERDWGFWYGVGIVVYGVAIMLHGSLYFWRLFKRATASDTGQAS
ncbi:MAG: hypothetical protein WC708_14175 [Lentisphaeria bacterium]